MTNEWHYTVNGQQAAPVNAVQLKHLAVSGQLKPTDLVWQEGMTGWMPASSIKGLFPSGKGISDSAIVPPASAAKPPTARKPGGPAVPRDWANVHPLLVLALTVVTGGVFGLFYSYKVCRTYATKAGVRTMDTAGRRLGSVHHPLGVLLLSYLTLGFYFYYWAFRVLRECNEYTGRKEVNPRTELSLMLIFPPYALYVAVFELPELIRAARALAGLPEAPALRQAIFFLNPCLFFALPFLAMISQEALNQVWYTAP